MQYALGGEQTQTGSQKTDTSISSTVTLPSVHNPLEIALIFNGSSKAVKVARLRYLASAEDCHKASPPHLLLF